MEDNIIRKLITKVKVSFSKSNKTNPSFMEYAFSSEEIKDLSKENKQKISELKQDIFSQKKEVIPKEDISFGPLSPIEGTTKIDFALKIMQDEKKEENISSSKEDLSCNEGSSSCEKKQDSFVELSLESQQLVMDSWEKISFVKLDKDIMEGKELLNHNYTIVYADEAARYIHRIRKEYEVVICYLIGFNNEKKGIYSKTIFSSNVDDEWKYLSNYIKVLETIRNFKNKSDK